jgi:hypothetical protein
MAMPVGQGVLNEPAQNRGQLGDAAPFQGLRRTPRELLRGLVEDIHPPARPHCHHPALDGGQRLLQLLVDLQHALVRLGIPDGHRGLVGQGLQ